MTKKSNFDENAESSQIEDTNSTSSRRRLLIGATVPAVLSLVSLPAFGRGGARCTISGFTSVNPSGVRHDTNGCGGYSPGGWGNPYSNGDGSVADWKTAGQNCATIFPGYGFENGFFPNPQNANDPAATEFADIFGVDMDSLHDRIKNEGAKKDNSDAGKLAKFAGVAFLNACFFQWGTVQSGKMHPIDVVGLYQAIPGQSYTTISGSIVTRPSDADLKDFFEGTQH